MYHEVTLKFRINTRHKAFAKVIADNVMADIKQYEDSAIVFVEKPELLSIAPQGVACHDCKFCYCEEVVIGDRGNGIESMIKCVCTKKGKRIPDEVHFCDDYEEWDVL